MEPGMKRYVVRQRPVGDGEVCKYCGRSPGDWGFVRGTAQYKTLRWALITVDLLRAKRPDTEFKVFIYRGKSRRYDPVDVSYESDFIPPKDMRSDP